MPVIPFIDATVVPGAKSVLFTLFPTTTRPVFSSTCTLSPAAASACASVATCGCKPSISYRASSDPAHRFRTPHSAHSRR